MGQKMSNAAIEARRTYQNEWRRKNKERVQEYNAQYWQRKAEESKQKAAEETKHE